MTLFVVLAALMVVVALGLLGLPLFRARSTDGRSALVVVGVLAIAVPAAAALIYRDVSNWNWDPAKMAAAYAGQQSIDDMVRNLEDHLAKHPDEVESWLMLGRTRFVMSNYPRAVDAFSSAYKLSNGKNLQAVIGYGESMALVDQTTIGGRAGELFEEALKLDPSNAKALFYGGAAAAARNQPELARDRWAQLVKQPLPDEVRVAVALRIGQIDQQLGRPADPQIAQLMQGAPPAPQEPATMTAAAGPGVVTVHVSLNAELARRVAPGTPLFVLARDPGQPGPPFAAKRLTAAQLPMDVTLTEQDAMMPGRTLKDAHALVIVARYSASGRPVASSGDIYGEVPYNLANGQTAALVIDKLVP